MSNKSIFDHSEIEPIKYDGSVDDFRAWMDGVLQLAGEIPLMNSVPDEEVTKRAFDDWKKGGMKGHIINLVQYYPRLIIKYSQHNKSTNREVWYVTKYNPLINDDIKSLKKWGTILALQTLNITTVKFLDGVCFRALQSNGRIIDYARTDFIGEDFSWYVQFIKEEWGKQLDNTNKTRKEINLQTKPAGRKIDPWNPQAFDIMNDGNENSELRAFKFWCEKQGIQKPNASERGAFKKAMKREEERRSRNR